MEKRNKRVLTAWRSRGRCTPGMRGAGRIRLSEERKARRHWLGLDKALVIQEEHADLTSIVEENQRLTDAVNSLMKVNRYIALRVVCCVLCVVRAKCEFSPHTSLFHGAALR